uniref:Methyltransferase 6, tRNA N3-cytidine n=1 Tax=Ailuropoda melanoleuca TaxID=9646 RepID=A0A7N5K420_AILME
MASLQRKGLQARILSSEEQEKLKRDQALVSDFKQQKLEKEAQKNWDLFYKRNSTNFFKDRHWTTREFEELKSCREVLKPGKSVLFRDYGLYDHAMLRFKAGSKLGENFYARQDGTRSYFFTDEFLARLFTDTGYEEVVNEYVFRETVNKKEGLCVPRVFLQSKFRKCPKNPTPVTLGPGHKS